MPIKALMRSDGEIGSVLLTFASGLLPLGRRKISLDRGFIAATGALVAFRVAYISILRLDPP
jgi:hypothetical protein